jgi:hypothetical protein
MSSSVKKISTIDRLIQEKHELRTKCTYQEKLISYKFEELKRNFPQIINNELLPFTTARNTEVIALLDVVNSFIIKLLPAKYSNSRLVEIVMKLAEVIVIRGFRKKPKSEK